jgi:hypothetical protein
MAKRKGVSEPSLIYKIDEEKQTIHIGNRDWILSSQCTANLFKLLLNQSKDNSSEYPITIPLAPFEKGTWTEYLDEKVSSDVLDLCELTNFLEDTEGKVAKSTRSILRKKFLLFLWGEVTEAVFWSYAQEKKKEEFNSIIDELYTIIDMAVHYTIDDVVAIGVNLFYQFPVHLTQEKKLSSESRLIWADRQKTYVQSDIKFGKGDLIYISRTYSLAIVHKIETVVENLDENPYVSELKEIPVEVVYIHYQWLGKEKRKGNFMRIQRNIARFPFLTDIVTCNPLILKHAANYKELVESIPVNHFETIAAELVSTE